MKTLKSTSRAIGALCVMGVFAPSTALAGNILYCNDYNVSTDHMAAALSTLSSIHSITSTTSMLTCESVISSGSWDLVVLAIQNNSFATPNFNSYVSSGGLAILQDWTRDGTRGAAIGVTYNSTNSSSMTVTSTDLSSGLSSASVSFTNPGWGVYTMGMSTSYTSAAIFASGDVAIAITNSSNAIVNGFLTDTITSASDAEQLYINEVEYLLGSCDEDEDGYDAIGACGGTDCDDTDASVYPGATEYCNGYDDNCDGTIDEDTAADAVTWYADSDSDSYGDVSVTDVDCYQPTGYVADSTDCDDTVATTYPGADEYCNGVDDDCDGTIDEDTAVDAVSWYADADSDGYGDPSVSDTECYQPSGYVADNTDCDDTVATTNPGATEYCNSVDDDCDGDIDEDTAFDAVPWYADTDSDGYGDPAVVDTECYQPSGYVADNTDCDDSVSTTYPGADEYCNSVDDDCDGVIDEDTAVDAVTWHADADADGYGNAAVTDIECDQPSGFVLDDTDCDDTDPDTYPGAPEVPYDGIDQDCDGEDECDVDEDDYTAEECGGDDCDDEDADINPEAVETWYDGVDQDCDDADDYDADGDGYTSASYEGDDCDDADADIYPGAPDEPYDGIITDCDDADEYDADGDGSDSAEYGGDDCDDANSEIGPEQPETWYDGIDDDCDGNDDDQDSDGYSVDEDCDDTDDTVFPGDGIYDEDCLEPSLDTGGITEDALGIATGGGGLKGCATTKTSALFGFLGLSLLGLRRRRQG
jgi:hypothetical protein